MLLKTQSPIDQADAAIRALRIGSGAVTPPPVLPFEFKRRNPPPNLGLDFRMIPSEEPIAGGFVDVFPAIAEFALAPPPDGYGFFGDLTHVTALEGLEVFGGMQILIAYDPGISTSSELRVARMANGRRMVLPGSADPFTGYVTGFYDLESFGSGQDQFGSFALVRPVPEASPLLLSLAGFLVLALRKDRRRRSGRP